MRFGELQMGVHRSYILSRGLEIRWNEPATVIIPRGRTELDARAEVDLIDGTGEWAIYPAMFGQWISGRFYGIRGPNSLSTPLMLTVQWPRQSVSAPS